MHPRMDSRAHPGCWVPAALLGSRVPAASSAIGHTSTSRLSGTRHALCRLGLVLVAIRMLWPLSGAQLILFFVAGAALFGFGFLTAARCRMAL